MDKAAPQAAAAAEKAANSARPKAADVGSILNRTAEALEQSAKLADQHAQRHKDSGRYTEADEERRAAGRARQASRQARARAVRLLKPRGD